MILHLANDEKIIGRTMEIFEEVYPFGNLWVITNRSCKKDLSTIQPTPKTEHLLLGRKEFLKDIKGNISAVVERCGESTGLSENSLPGNGLSGSRVNILIHLLNPRKINIVRQIQKALPATCNVKIYWIIWGLDLYNKLLAPAGFEMFTSDNVYSGLFDKSFGAFNRIGAAKEAKSTVKFIEKSVDYIVTDTTESDYSQLVKYYPQLAAKPWKDFFYYPIDTILGELYYRPLPGGSCKETVMVGNSASRTNNHKYLLALLSQFDLRGKKVVVPLSYSGRARYVNEVVAYGKKEVEGFVPLMKFMPLDEYNRLQSSTAVALFGNLRQEAIGNIMIALYMGAKVFLFESNPVYEWAATHNLKVYPMSALSQVELDTLLPAEDAEHNRSVLRELYSKRRMMQLIKELF
ncbi:MAG: TDP-N-acetylfucosamine:lipid II N-acetylfucosaminyltransferase [Bacteroidales bacterium]|nr:TDP-N-acetylfucosamine:lipid II N-acetylfucosaminyltransferase [Bacteroidales bacterium]